MKYNLIYSINNNQIEKKRQKVYQNFIFDLGNIINGFEDKLRTSWWAVEFIVTQW